jgi:putative serine protease PepD
VVAAVIVAMALLGAGYLVGQAQRTDQRLSSGALAATSTSIGETTPRVPAAGDQPVVAVASALSPAVVQIQTPDGLGSGIVYDATGLIVTNAHVVGTATSVQVTRANGQTLSGKVVGADPSSDVAVVRVDPGSSRLTAAKLARAEPAVGSVAVAIGSPFGLSGTVTSGVVSAVDRPLENEADVAVNMIQTDAAINPGNSGGALADINGEVIGVNAEILSQSGDNNGIGFAIPIRTAMAVAAKITAGHSLAKPVVGVAVRNDPSGAAGAYVATVNPGSPAAKAGLRTGDLILSIDGTTVATSGDFVNEVMVHSPGQRATLRVERDHVTLTVEVTLTTG